MASSESARGPGRQTGFSLLETIIAVCLVGLVGAMTVALTHDPNASATAAHDHTRDQYVLQQEMDEIVAEYRRLLRVSQATATPFTAADFVAALNALQNPDTTPKFKYKNASKSGYLAPGQVSVAGGGDAFAISANLAYRVTLTTGDQSYAAIFVFPN